MNHAKLLSVIAPLVAFNLFVMSAQAEDWTRFRGPNGSGISSASRAPSQWSESNNLKWSVDLPGRGSSCPIVVGDKVLLTAYTGYGLEKSNPGDPKALQRHLICFDRASGKELWRGTVDSTHDEDPYQGFIAEHGYASSTPVSDGEHVFVLFGKTGMVAFDMDGNQKWLQNLGEFSDPAKWGSGASAVLYKDFVIVNAGIEGHKIVALKKSDGSVAWEVENPEFTNCWSTPILVTADMRDELVFSMPGKILALDPENGKVLWTAKSPIAQTVCASLAEQNGVVFAMGGRQGSAVAIRCGGNGDVSESNTVWEMPLRAGIGTPLVHNGKMYWSSGGIAYCADCKTGEYVYKERLKTEEETESGQRRGPAGDYASPVMIGDRIMLLMRNGTAYVIKPAEKLETVSQNSFASDQSQFNATPAVTENQIFIRSDKKLYCIQSAE
jgi:outer membrane protein assembly factor BamB